MCVRGGGQAHGHRDLLCGLDMDDEVELFRQWEKLHVARAHTETQDVYKVCVLCSDTRFVPVHPPGLSVLRAFRPLGFLVSTALSTNRL
jgi:hypothetical protein